MKSHKFSSVFRRGSKTYYTSSFFFPENVKDDIYTFYAFVRIADDYVDSIPQKKKEFRKFVNTFKSAWNGKITGNLVIDEFVALIHRKGIPKADIMAFITAMESDLSVKRYPTLQDLETYTYGSAEVIGLIMAKLLNLSKDSRTNARLLGKSMQFLNFIRDIEEDNRLGRIYFPRSDMRKFKLQSLDYTYIQSHPDQFKKFMQFQLNRYAKWQNKAELGFCFIPRRYRIAIQTASEMYKWTARIIAHDPFVIYRKKVKPGTIRILFCALIQTIKIYTGL